MSTFTTSAANLSITKFSSEYIADVLKKIQDMNNASDIHIEQVNIETDMDAVDFKYYKATVVYFQEK